MEIKNPILLAQIGAPHGIKGEVRVKSFTGDPLALGDYGSLYDKDGRKFKIMKLRPQKDILVIKFKGVNYRDEAEALNRIELFIDRSMLPDDADDDEFYVTDLIGMDALNTDGEKIGTVKDVPNFGAGDLVELILSNRTTLIEFSKANVPEINLEARTITVHLPNEVSERDEF